MTNPQSSAQTTGDTQANPPPTGVLASLRATRVQQLMSTPVHTVQENQTRAQASRLMLKEDISSVVVVDSEGRAVGMISKTDVVREEHGEARSAGVVGRVTNFMTPFLLRLRPEHTLSTATVLMHNARVHHVLVTDGEGRPVGMLSSMDVLDWLAGFATESDLPTSPS